MGFWKNAFAMSAPEPKPLTPRQEEILERLAAKVVEWKMSVPAILFLESVKPLNYIGSQVLVFFAPIVRTIYSNPDYDEFVALMEERGNVELLLRRIEQKEAVRESGPRGAAAGKTVSRESNPRDPGRGGPGVGDPSSADPRSRESGPGGPCSSDPGR